MAPSAPMQERYAARRPPGSPRIDSCGTDTCRARSVTRPMTEVPGCRAWSSRAASDACCAGTTAQKPHPMLKTSHISITDTGPNSAISSKTGGTGSGSLISKPMCSPSLRRLVSPQQLQDRAHVDDGGLQQHVGDRLAAELRRLVVELQAAGLQQRPPGQA